MALKKYLFLTGCLGVLLAGSHFGLQGWVLSLAVLVAWIFFENQKRLSPRFMHGAGVHESIRRRPSDVIQIGVADSQAWALYRDRTLALWDDKGKLCWERPLDSGAQTLLPNSDGRLWLALGQELVCWNAEGRSIGRLSFEPPPFQQSYQLLKVPMHDEIALHTPWFTQFASGDLQSLGTRLPYQELDHYTKYAAFSPDGQNLLVAGARLLEDEAKSEARWSLWSRHGEAWQVRWRHQESSSSSSHLRGLHFATHAPIAALEIYKEGYEFRIIDPTGALLWRRDGEKPLLSSDGELLLWENPYEGVTLSRVRTHEKLWATKFEEHVRAKWFDSLGRIWVQSGRILSAFNMQGEIVWAGHWVNDPFLFLAFGDGLSLIAARQDRLAILRLA